MPRASTVHGEGRQFERRGLVPRFTEYCGGVLKKNGFQDFRSYHFIVGWRLNAVVEDDAMAWDFSAIPPVVCNGDGTATDHEGQPIGTAIAQCLTINGRTHEAMLELFRQREF